MPWNEPGGNNQQDPWTGKNKSKGKQDAEEIINTLNKKLNSLFGGGGRGGDNGDGGSGGGVSLKVIAILLGIVFAGWLFSGFYTVDAREQGLVLRFGQYVKTVDPGLHWHLPTPIEKVELVDVTQNRSSEDRSIMLTKDENIVDVAVTAQYRVSNAEDYKFNVKDPDSTIDQTRGTLYQAMRSATREIIGRNKMDFILRDGREQIAQDIEILMQNIMDRYELGLKVLKVNLTYAEAPEEVKDAFDEANRAREDANRFKNQADTYANKVLPDARGQAARLLEEARAYRDRLVARAEGDASRFSQLATEYQRAPSITRDRLYLDTMENVMKGTPKVLIDSDNNNLFYLPIGNAENTSAMSKDSAVPAAAGSLLENSNYSSSSSNNSSGLRRQAERESR